MDRDMFLVDRAVVSIPGLCRCPGDEQQEDQEEERCFVPHGDGFPFPCQAACLCPAREGRLHTALITDKK